MRGNQLRSMAGLFRLFIGNFARKAALPVGVIR